jgi:uncharacterized iron-regulated membrane protein
VLRTQLTGATTGGGGSHGAHGAASRSSAASTGWDEVDGVVVVAQQAGVTLPYVVSPPIKPGDAWSVAEVDNRWPIEAESVAIDPVAGRVVDRLTFADNPLLEQATTVGIGFHEGTLVGLVNQIGLTLLAAALIVLVVSGYIMWWRRRPPGAFGAPPQPRRLLRTVPVPLLGGGVLLGVLLPTLAVGFVAYLVAERVTRSFRPVPNQAA